MFLCEFPVGCEPQARVTMPQIQGSVSRCLRSEDFWDEGLQVFSVQM